MSLLSSLGITNSTSQPTGIKTGVNVGAGAIAVLTSANPAGAALTAAGTLANLVTNLNHPYGTCSPNAADANTFLACWKHPIPDNFIPVYKGGAQGWAWAYCPGAKGGRASAAGCLPGCDCSTGACVCAPAGAVMGLKNGTFVDAAGRNLGPAVARSGGTLATIGLNTPLAIQIANGTVAPLSPQQLALAGVPISNSVVPYSSTSGAGLGAGLLSSLGLGPKPATVTQAGVLGAAPTGASSGLIIIAVLAVGGITLFAALGRKHG
jgi:hypothetical protein